MYEKFYGLKEKPFQITPNPSYLYKSAMHENALTYFEYGLMENVGFIILTGEVGTGKTTLIRYILGQFESEKEMAVIFSTNVSVDELLYLILQAFELESEEGNKPKNLEIFQQFLIDKYAQNKQPLLVIDEAQNLSDEALEEIRMLSNLQGDDQNLIQIMLVGQPELKARLKQPIHASFSQRIAVNLFLSGLTAKETKSYITYRLESAGGRGDIFNQEAIDMIYKASRGIPRSINMLCDSALVYGFGYEFETITPSVIEQVIKDKGGMGIIDGGKIKGSMPSSSFEREVNREDGNRLQGLENAVESMQRKVDSLIEVIQEREKGLKEDLIERLKNLLLQERKRSDEILVNYSQLKVKYDNLMKNEKGEHPDQKWIKRLIKKQLVKRLKNTRSGFKTSD
jgi:type II secretory pathway predicted ATPase ExeA